MNGDLLDKTPIIQDEGEMGELKRRYGSNLSTLKEMFPDWTDEDLVFALQETNGDLESTIDRISEGMLVFSINCSCAIANLLHQPGNITQWGEVKKKTKDRAQPKPKENSAPVNETANVKINGRGRGGSESVRGARSRGSDRARGISRGGRASSAVNAPRNPKPDKAPADVPAPEKDETAKVDGVEMAADDVSPAENTNLSSSWENINAADAHVGAPPAETPQASSRPDGTRSWASMFAKPKAAPVPVPKKTSQPPPSAEAPSEPSLVDNLVATEPIAPDLPQPLPVQDHEPIDPERSQPIRDVSSGQVADITPSKDELTESNLEQVADVSAPAPTATAASTVASTLDARVASGASQVPSSRPPMGGFATSAYKATATPGRTTSFQRKIMEQQEAVVMPGKHAVDRAAVQFGSLGLNGESEEWEGDREDPETRAQPPQHSPIAPRASLPPAVQFQGPLSQSGTAEPAPKQAPGLPPANPHAFGHLSQGDQAPSHPAPQQGYSYNQFSNRNGPPTTQAEAAAPAQKPYEPFGSQLQSQYSGFPPTASTESQAFAQTSQASGQSSAPGDMSYYSTDNQRHPYQPYYAGIGQQSQPSPREAPAQQRVGSAVGTSGAEQPSQHVPHQTQSQFQARYGQIGEGTNSGNSTPNPPGPHGHGHQGSSAVYQAGQGQAGGQQGGFPYSHQYYNYPQQYSSYGSQHPYGRERPMFDDARRYEDSYMSHNPSYGYGAGQAGYGGGPFGGAGHKQGMYGQSHQGYGQHSSYNQDPSSAAAPGGYGQQGNSNQETGASGFGAFGRSGSTQPADNQQQYPGGAPGSFGGMSDVYGRSGPSYPGQSQSMSNHQGSQQNAAEESLRAYQDNAKMAGGPSPASNAPGRRPGSAANNGQMPGGISTSQGQSQSYGSYPGSQMHGQHGSQYGAGPGGIGGHHQSGAQGHLNSGYGQYGGAVGGSYYGSNSRGGWGGNYGH